MKTFKVTVSPMGQHITDKSGRNETGLSYQKAVGVFLDLCNDLNIDFESEHIDMKSEANLEAGGRGHDYRLELESE